ncbi:Short-chain dehydrogenase/reductase family 9C member 7 [Seminavis robusta]|uniref:Short-chain dehydrogenase/reductase family 9C member 7 n=1 Tax=Seminavis robusta TaxID=568900 RepID=A0A9N8DF96_9STRA|nr:Short-chain dehydrogenase/reductase family 9C member 7 [Seminavis robusta]|eukprot:Sro65_g036720.1 Short-chain dehydrogenase/reductase family 9C member 7 (352) ;mRNA; r:58583-59638
MMTFSALPVAFLNAIVPSLVLPYEYIVKLIALAAAFLSVALAHRLVLRKEFPVHHDGDILISGTSSGIGRATCEWLAKQYPHITFYAGVQRMVQGSPFDLPNVKQVILDITNQDHVDAALELIKQDQLPLIAVINNAGLYDMSTFEFMGVDTLRKIMEVNVMGTYMLTQVALPMIRKSKGRIVTVSSISGLIPGGPLLAAYQGSKHALEAMFDALRVEVAPHDVSASLIEPGFLQSNIVEEIKWMQETASNNCNNQAMEVYPELMGERYLSLFTEMATTTGSMEETCKSIEDAIFDKYPQPRYLTSRVGALPAWLAAKVVNRLADIALHMETIVFMLRIRVSIEKMLGVAK